MKFVPKVALLALAAAVLVGCNNSGNNEKKVSDNAVETLPVFSLATSEYPSWSTFVVAKKAGLINGTDEGEPGSLEKKWGVRIKLEVKDYDPCLALYGGGTVDAVCMTNMDALNPALTRPSTVIMPTSTSVGGDKVIAVGVEKAEDLKGKKVHGLAKSVSEYVFVRGLEKKGLKAGDVQFANLDPAAAATALQTGQSDVKAICVWNPFALQTLRQAKGSKVVFDSSVIPEEVIDCVVMANDSLKKPGGDKAACLIADTFYEVCKRIDAPASADVTLKALGAEFSNLGVEDMRIVVKDTRFYSTPQAGTKLFQSAEFPKTMETVVKTSQQIGVLENGKAPTISYGKAEAQLTFTAEYMQRVAAGK